MRTTLFRRTSALATAALIATSLSTVTAQAASTTGSGVQDYSQCQNDPPPSSNLACSQWINGILNPNNSHYREGDVVPQRVLFTIAPTTAAQEHALVLSWTTRKNGVHAFDSLATWNHTQKNADHCQGLSKLGCPTGAFSTMPITADDTHVLPSTGSTRTSDHDLPDADRQLVLYGGQLTGMSGYTHANNTSPTGDADAWVTVRFTAPASSKSQKLQLLYGAHLASAAEWGPGLGSSSISGGPYHNMLSTLDGASVGSKDNQIQSGAVLPAAPAALQVVKKADATPVDAGTQIGFTVTVKNTGGTTASNVTVTDTLPTGTGLSWTESPDNPGCSISSGVLTCTIASLAPGATSTPVHIVSPTAYGSPATVSNTATASAPGVPSSSGSDTITIRKAVLDLVKTADAAAVNAGSDMFFTVKVTNTGNGTATGVVVSDPLPGGTGVTWSLVSGACQVTGTAPTQTLSCSYGSLAPQATVTARVKATTTGATSGDFRNTASVTSTNAPGDSDTATISVKAPAFTLTKKADSATVSAGDQVGYTVTASNAGPGIASGVTITDALPALTGVSWTVSPAVSGCSVSGNAPNQTLSCGPADYQPGQTLTVHLVSATTGSTSGLLDNTAYASGKNVPLTSSNAKITVLAADVAFSKTTTTPVVSAGDKVRFTISGKNNGAGDAKGITYSDTLPALGGALRWTVESQTSAACTLTQTLAQLLSCTVGTLAPGASYSVTLVGDTGPGTTGTLPNTALLKGTNVPDKTATSTITVLQPKLSTQKTADASPVSSGDAVGFTVSAVNAGPGTAYGVVISDPLPVLPGVSWSVSPAKAGCSIASSTLTCTVGTLTPAASPFSVHVTSGTTADTSGTLPNEATTTASNAATTKAGATIVVNKPVLALTKSADGASVDAGGQMGYVVTLTNTGLGNAYSVSLTDTPPTGSGVSWSLAAPVTGCTPTGAITTLTCTRALLGPGQSVSVHLVSGTSASACGTYKNTASAVGSNAPMTTTPEVTITVVCRPKLELVKEPTCVGQGTVPPGGFMSYTLRFKNTGTGSADDATLVDAFDPTTTPTSYSGGTLGSSTVTWDLPPLAAGAESSRTLVVKAGSPPGVITNKATISDPAALASASSSLSTTVTEAGAHTSGTAWAVDITGLPAPVDTFTRIGEVSTTAPGAPQDADSDLVPDLDVATVAHAELLPQDAHSEVADGRATSQARSTVADVTLLSGLVTATEVRSASSSTASALTAGSSGTGSTIKNLVVNGNPVASTPNTTVDVKSPLDSAVTVATLQIRSETAPNAGLLSGAFTTSHETTALTLTVLKAIPTLPLVPAGVVVRVGHAETEATYPSGLVCGTTPASVSGEAFVASASGKTTGTTLAFAKEGDAVLSPLGGSDADGVAALVAGTALVTGTGTTSTSGTLTPNPHATSRVLVEDVSLLGGAVTAKAVECTSTSDATGTAATTQTVQGCQFTQLVVGGQAVPVPEPNAPVAIPADGGTLFVVFNEQELLTTGGTDTAGTVNAIHAYLFKNGELAAEVIVASAHSDAHTSH